jgi:hypothetical protein
MMIDVGPMLVSFLLVAVVVGVLGVAVGILLIAPRMTRWVDRDEEPRDDG